MNKSRAHDCDRQKDRPHCHNRPHLHSTAMRSKT